MYDHRKVNHSRLTNIAFIFFLLIIVVLTIKVSFSQFSEPKVPQNAAEDQFSATRALEHLNKIAVEPHPIGSEENDRVKDYLLSTLLSLGVTPEVQKIDNLKLELDINHEGKLENILVRIPGEDSSMAIMVASHYDTADVSPGAGDAGAAVAAMLETIRALSQIPTLKNDLIIFISDGEEYGYYGAKAFIAQHPWAKDVGIVFNFEARGSSGPSVIFESNESNDRLISEYIKTARNPVMYSFLNDVYDNWISLGTDFSIFKNAGMYGLNFAFFSNAHTYHTPHDNVENLSLNSLQHHGESMLDLVKHFGNLELVEKEEGSRIFFNILGKNVMTYSENLVIPILLIIILIFAITFLNGKKRKQLTLIKTSVGFLSFILSAILASMIGHGLWMLMTHIFLESNPTIEAELKFSNPIFVGFIFLIVALIILLYRWVSMKIGIFNLTMGAYFGWLCLLIYTSLLFESSSYLFAWPLFFGLLGMNWTMKLSDEQLVKSSTITIGLSIPVILITVPALYLMYILFTLKYMGALLVLAILLTVFFIPILRGREQRFPFILSAVLFSIGSFILVGIMLFLLN